MPSMYGTQSMDANKTKQKKKKEIAPSNIFQDIVQMLEQEK